jgi:hypothetical protein
LIEIKKKMKGIVFIDNDEIGSADFKVIDESMGGIQGELNPTQNYKKYKKRVQDLFDKKGIANVDDFNFKIILDNKTELKPEGGIGITDSSEFDEILVESAGLDYKIIEIINNGQ